MKTLLQFAVFGVLLCISEGFTQLYPDTLWVPVTFYDFHSNGSNPEFEASYTGGTREGMVDSLLDAQNKPILGPRPFLNYYIHKWYRPWAAGDFTRPSYSNNGQTYNGAPTVNYDTSFKNIVINRTLPFIHQGRNNPSQTGVYQYYNTNFFPLDNIGFGNETRNHNFSFSMELHWSFTKRQGLTFNFTGDDDVWVFVNGRLKLEIGGIHTADSRAFSLDNDTSLHNGEDYTLSLFYAERHTTMSTIRITTNIIAARPNDIRLDVFPNDTICAGQSARIIANVLDTAGRRMDSLSNLTTWSILNGNANNNNDLSSLQNDTVFFRPRVAYVREAIVGRLGSANIQDTIYIVVQACTPHHITIEGQVPSMTDTVRLRNEHPLSNIRISSTMTRGSGYAIVRDTFGNFIEPSQRTTWNIDSGAAFIDSVVSANPSQGLGYVYKNLRVGAGRGVISARSNDYSILPDDVPVIIDAVNYDALRIAIPNPSGSGYIPITNFTTTVDDSTRLIVQGRRTDNGQWEATNGAWMAPNGIRTRTQAPNNSDYWMFSPRDTGTGTIGVQSLVNTSLSAQCTVHVGVGRPAELKLYPNATDSAYANPSHLYIDSAGIPFPLYAKIYDRSGNWLRTYDNLNAPISWSYQIVSGTERAGDYQRPNGNQNRFTPVRAGNILFLIATLDGTLLSDTVRILVVPGRPHHITVQSDSDTTGNRYVDISDHTINSGQSSINLYAILRDSLENIINYVVSPIWTSRDTSVVKAEGTSNVYLGEGEITRNTIDVRHTWVTVASQNNRFKDSLIVRLSNMTYDSLRIYVKSGRPLVIDSIVIPTDDDSTLYVEGKRHDGQGWVNIPVSWYKSSSLLTKDSLPRSAVDNWNVRPDQVGTGKIWVTYPGAVPDTVVAIFIPGNPDSVEIHRQAGRPTPATRYRIHPLIDTLTAGRTYPLYGKVFDKNHDWLSAYENASKNNLFSWLLQPQTSGMIYDTLSSVNGFNVSFTPKHAYVHYKITVTFRENAVSSSDYILVYVKPDTAHHLVIEANHTPTGAELQKDMPVEWINFDSRTKQKSAYAIIRDQFGNYVQNSLSTNWISRQPAKVTASEGFAPLGEGSLVRVDSLGDSIRVVANNRNKPTMIDSVLVKLNAITYDSLRIVVNDSVRIDSLVMRSDQDTILQVIGKRSTDSLWVLVGGDWNYNSNNGSLSATNQLQWNFAPGDTGTGKIVVSRGSAVPDTITVKIKPGLPARLVIYPREGIVPAANNVQYPDPISAVVTVAGTAFPLVGKVLDHKNVWLSEYETIPASSKLIRWTVKELPGTDSSGFLDDTAGHKRSFMPVRAYQNVYVISSFQYGTQTFKDTILLSITPGPVRQLVIEGSSNWESSKNKANPITRVQITDSMTNAKVYAILRDSIGNFVRYSTLTSWGVVQNDTAVTVQNGNTNLGEGIIRRKVREKMVKVYAVDESGYRDTVDVELLPYYYKELRIIVGKDTAAQSLTMNTNQDTSLHVQGLRSDSLIWVNVDAQWGNSQNLEIVPSAPGWGNSWTFSPSDTGRGIIWATLDNNGITRPDTLPVVFTVGPPIAIDIKIITPEDKRIVNQPISFEVSINNEDGPVPGVYCLPNVQYADVLGDGGKRSRPFMMVGTDTLWLTLPDSSMNCFEGGKDTVVGYFYNSPHEGNNKHMITVKAGDLTSTSEPFVVLPGPLDSLIIERQNGTPIRDVTLLYPTGQIVMIATGYDAWGNKIGPINSNWSTDGTLHPIEKPNNTYRIYYDAANVTDNESGFITAVPVEVTSKTIKAVVPVKIIGMPITITSAITRDLNGNGLLDHIELHFSKDVTLPDDFTSKLKVIDGGYAFSIDTVVKVDNGHSDFWMIKLRETQSNTPQTSWTPLITTPQVLDNALDSMSTISTDGAGPVVWSVTKTIVVSDNRREDSVRVTFSEPVQHGADNLTLQDIPFVVFYVWEKNPDGTGFILIDSCLAGINGFISASDSIVTFKTSNNFDLSSRHYVSIKTVLKSDTVLSYITDNIGTGNLPQFDNLKVRVAVTGNPPPKLIAGPNPTTASRSRILPGIIKASHEPSAVRWVKEDKAGVALSFQIPIPEELNVKIKCTVKIYDAVGNKVIEGHDDNLKATIARDTANEGASIYQVYLYWNGYNSKQMKIAPGAYKVFVYAEYYGAKEASKYTNIRLSTAVGFKK